jgi:predicted lipoprotein
MTNIHEYYDDMADISVSVTEAIESLELAKSKVQEALIAINSLKKYGDTTISYVSNVTTNDVHRNLLFLELLFNQTYGVINTFVFQELLELANYSVDEEEL